ncbi:Uncharacterised protein [uncultured archaeon]|nr:Uncharacterised protein [uncultured archaeon]
MASSVRIRSTGNSTFENVTFENFSTESTLSDLLDQFKSFASNFTTTTTNSKTSTDKAQTTYDKILQKLGINPAKAGAAEGKIGAGAAFGSVLGPAVRDAFGPLGRMVSGIAEMTPEVFGAVVAFKAVELGLRAFQETLNFISRSIASIFSVTGNLVNTFLSGKIALSDYFQAIAQGTKSIPIIGMLTSTIASAVTQLDNLATTVTELEKAGAPVQGGVVGLLTSSAEAGLTVEQFTNVIKSNIEYFASFGSVMRGMGLYTRVANASISSFGSTLADMGISFAQYSEELPKILSLFSVSMRTRTVSENQLKVSAEELFTQFDAIAKLTGKTRQQQEEDLKKNMADAAWTQAISYLNGPQKASLDSSFNILSTIMPTLGDAFKAVYMNMPFFTDELKNFNVLAPNARARLGELVDAVKNGVSGEKLVAIQHKVIADIMAEGVDRSKGFNVGIAAAGTGFDKMASLAKVATEFMGPLTNSFIKNGELDQKLFLDSLNKAAKHGKSLDDMYTDSLLEFQKYMTQLRETFVVNILAPFLRSIAPTIHTIVTTLEQNQGPIQIVFAAVRGLLMEFANWLRANQGNVGTMVNHFIDIVTKVIRMTIDTIRFMYQVGVFVHDHWDTIKGFVEFLGGIVLGLMGVLGWQVGKGLLWALSGAVSGIGGILKGIGGLIPKLLGLGGTSEGLTTLGLGAAGTAEGAAGAAAGTAAVAGAGTAAEGAGILGLGAAGTAAEGTALGGVVAGEAATGVGIPLAVATGLVGGGLLLWQYMAHRKEEQQKQAEEQRKQQEEQAKQHQQTMIGQGSMTDTNEGSLNAISQILLAHSRLLAEIIENTNITARYSRKTAAAVS